jgi:hypothetical protein
MSCRDFLHALRRESTQQGSTNRRFIIDLDFVAQTVYQATNFDGDSFTRSFCNVVPVMPVNVKYGSATSCLSLLESGKAHPTARPLPVTRPD